MILIVNSNLDLAGVNIAKHVLQNNPFHKATRQFQENPTYQSSINGKEVTLITLSEEAVKAQDLPENFPEAELIVFISRHSSQSGTPTLSVHTPGNIGKADMGGLQRTVSVSPAFAMKIALETMRNLRDEQKLEYEVSYECTHHGPSLKVPTMFVELGSSEKQWNDQKAANVVAKAAIDAVIEFGTSTHPAALGIGGTHYNKKFTKMALNGDAVFGHMIPKYALSQIDSEILLHCLKRTHEEVESAILDWKGIRSEDKPGVLAALKETGLPIKKV